MKLMANLRIPLINRVEAAGRLTRDPEIMTGKQSGKEYTKCGFAYAAPKDAPSMFVDLKAFGMSGEILAGLRKGNPVFIEGKLDIGHYEKDGTKHKTISVIVDRVNMLEWPDDDASAATPPPARNDAQRVSVPPPVHPASSQEDDIPF